nr:unnamed protein product [Callosobruchus analis]
MCCPYECPPQMCSSNESIEEDCSYDPCCQCSACQEPCPPPCCPPRPCTPFPCPPRRPPRPCNPCCPPPRCPPPPRCAPRPCNPCLPPPCCPCKVKGKFGLAYIVETPKNRCETPLGWQIEFEDTPSKIASSCKKMMQWVNCPPLGECGTEAVMSGYPKKCARALASNPNQCCYEDTPLPPCDCESEPKCCCRPKPQKCCKPRPKGGSRAVARLRNKAAVAASKNANDTKNQDVRVARKGAAIHREAMMTHWTMCLIRRSITRVKTAAEITRKRNNTRIRSMFNMIRLMGKMKSQL